LLHDAHPVLLNFGDAGSIDIAPWRSRVKLIDARYEGPVELPVLGEVSLPTAVLIRPDGYVAWVAEQSEQGLRDALIAWVGLPQ
jgi:3-(3-hydroxy-phenyl)propionate hydroxylase